MKKRISPSKRELMKERFSLSHYTPPSPMAPDPIYAILPNVIKKMGLEKNYWRQALENDWKFLVGSELARHSRPGPLERHRLIVYVTHPIWLNALRQSGEKVLLKKIQKKYHEKTIKFLTLRIDPDIYK